MERGSTGPSIGASSLFSCAWAGTNPGVHSSDPVTAKNSSGPHLLSAQQTAFPGRLALVCLSSLSFHHSSFPTSAYPLGASCELSVPRTSSSTWNNLPQPPYLSNSYTFLQVPGLNKYSFFQKVFPTRPPLCTCVYTYIHTHRQIYTLFYKH